MAYLHQSGFRSFTVTDLVSGLFAGKFDSQLKPVVITFDDGFADFSEQALPILTAHSMQATVYIVTQYVGGKSLWLAHEGESTQQMMTWEQISSARQQGIEIGAHGHKHRQLDVIPSDEVLQDIIESKQTIEEHLGHSIYSFAYPHGYHSRSIQRMVQKAGFTSACGVKHAMSSTEDDPFALARLIVSPDMDMEKFPLLLAGHDLPVAPYPERVQTKAWRGMRWVLARLSNRVG
jgi:peptidoglycan/xylan/chitin deacetylase (PgdA/CDA1 family)